MPRQAKALIIYNENDHDRLYYSTAFDRCESGGWRLHVTQGGSDQGIGPSGPAVNNEWVRLESYLVQSGVSQSNGGFWGSFIRGNSISNSAKTGVMRTDSIPWVQLTIGGAYYSMCDSSDPATIDVDNIYIDNTPQRVEVGNASTWTACTHREIQIPSAWSSNSITFSVNQGAFTSGQQAYLYVVDSTGAVNASGYPITIGGSIQPALPGDFNSDGIVNIFDYNIFLQNFSNQACGNICDMNSDCTVNIFDYNLFLGEFGKTS